MSKTTYFELNKPAGTDPVAISELNDNMDTIDTEMHKPPLTVNGVSPDASRNVSIETVPLAENLVSDESQVVTGSFVIRASGGDASIENGTANISTIMGNSVKTGFVQENISLTVIQAVPDDDDPLGATVDRDTLVAYMASSGTVTFMYSTAWSPDVSLYGITVTGTPHTSDQIILNYTKGNRGTIAVPNPVKFVATGWNLYNNTAGYARVPKYSETYGFIISGTYTLLEFSSTLSGSRTTITPTSGHFTIPSDGYLFVTGGNATDTAIYMTWGDWTDGTPESFAAYSQEEIDLSGIMVNFPTGLMRVGAVADEINFNTQTAVKRITRISYDEDDLAELISNGIPYDTDTNYIYYVRPDPVSYEFDLDGDYTANDHGTELFTGTTTPAYATILYGQDLAGKLRRDVVTISPMDLTDEQKAQVRQSIGALGEIAGLTGLFMTKTYTLLENYSLSGNNYKNESADMPEEEGYTPVGIVSYRTAGTRSTYLIISTLFYNEESGKIEMVLRNSNSSGASGVTLEVTVLFMKTS